MCEGEKEREKCVCTLVCDIQYTMNIYYGLCVAYNKPLNLNSNLLHLIHFRTTMVQGRVIFLFFLVNIYETYERGLVIIDITMACDLSFKCIFFPAKTMEKNPFWALGGFF